jgi:hypothetical protein
MSNAVREMDVGRCDDRLGAALLDGHDAVQRMLVALRFLDVAHTAENLLAMRCREAA